MNSFSVFRRMALFFSAAAILFFCGCGDIRELPIDRIKKHLKDSPTYSIILEDMKEEGNFSKQYFHKYRVIQMDEGWTTDWFKVPKDYYHMNEKFMGMTLFAKKDGEDIKGAAPPGYAYVGDTRYGHWRNDSSGRSFWEFYGKYRLLADFFGGWYRPVYRNDYDTYRNYRARHTPYFGSRNQFGTDGSLVKSNKPDFYARHMQKERIKRESFSSKVSQRIGRTRTSFRSRAGGRGK